MQDNDTDTAVAKSKEDRYRWRKNTEPGEFQMVSVSKLNVDHAYQRSATPSAVSAIARNFNWVAFGMLIVARRPDGTLWVIDGGHRCLAAKARSDTSIVPCMIWNIADIAEEASHFNEMNTHRKAVDSFTRFRSLLVAGDPVAVKVADLAESNGYQMVAGKSGNTGKFGLRCASTLLKLMRDKEQVLRDVMAVIFEANPNGDYIHETVIEGLCEIESHLRRSNSGVSLSDANNREKIATVGLAALHEEAIGATRFFKQGGCKIWARGILQALNRSRRTRLLPEL